MRKLVAIWRDFHAHDIYRADSVSMLRSGASWMTLLSMGWLLAKWRRLKPKSLLDNTPLAKLLKQWMPLERLPWVRSHRRGLRDKITHQHLLASSAIPFIFPAMALPLQGQTAYFGDGSMRQTAPIAPAIHLGAERICVIGAGLMHEPRTQPAG